MAEDMSKLIKHTLSKIPSATDRVHMLHEYEVPKHSQQAEALLLQIRAKYNDIMRYALNLYIKSFLSLTLWT